MASFYVFRLYIVVVGFSLIAGTSSLKFSGCFTLQRGTKPINVGSLGWSSYISGSNSITDCVEMCSARYKKYAAVETVASGQIFCSCGTENAYQRLGAADHTWSHVPCHHREWKMQVYLSSGDVSSQYLGCYKEVTDTVKMASTTNLWIDRWGMSPEECTTYCKQNRASYANLKNGDTCTCGISFAKYGQIDESFCNKTCVGSLGEKCGGDQANSVYYAQSVADMLRTVLGPTILLGSRPVAKVSVPHTLALMKDLVNLQKSLTKQIPTSKTELVRSHLTRGVELLQDIVDMTAPLNTLIQSKGFQLSNSQTTRHLLSVATYPPQLQSFVDVVIRAQSFIDQNVAKLMISVTNAIRTVGLLRSAASDALASLDSFFTGYILNAAVDRTLQVAQLMISASRNCLPLLESSQTQMINNLEGASRTLDGGSAGMSGYIQSLNQPLSNLSSIGSPVIDSTTWRGSLIYVAQSWTAFMSGSGTRLVKLLQKKYDFCPSTATGSIVFGKRAICTNPIQLDFADMVSRPGVSKAKEDMDKFITANQVIYKAVDWSVYDSKITSIQDDFKSVFEYLAKAGISTPNDVKTLAESMTSFKFHQSCLNLITTMIQDVCYTNANPNESKVAPIRC